MSRVRVSEREGGDARCPYCRDALAGALPTKACEGCDLVAHVDCWAALVKCPTLGCGREAPPTPPAPPGPARPFTVGGTTTITPPANGPDVPVERARRRERQRRDRRQAPGSEVPRPDRQVSTESAGSLVLALVMIGVVAYAGSWFMNGEGGIGTYSPAASRGILAGACFLVFAIGALISVGVMIWRHLKNPPP